MTDKIITASIFVALALKFFLCRCRRAEPQRDGNAARDFSAESRWRRDRRNTCGNNASAESEHNACGRASNAKG